MIQSVPVGPIIIIVDQIPGPKAQAIIFVYANICRSRRASSQLFEHFLGLIFMTRRVLSAELQPTQIKLVGFVFGFLMLGTSQLFSQDSAPSTAPSTRTAWTTSRVKGSPDAPLPLAIEPAFPNLKFNDSMHVRWQADLGRYFVCELGGKVWSFPHDAGIKAADLTIDLKASLKSYDADRSGGVENLFSISFDPEFARNRYVYLCMVLSSKTGQPLPDGSRISRFRVTEEMPPRIDVKSELPIITWLAGGHNGCDMAFDSSGCLLFSTGDATDPSPPDRLKTGQDISDLLSSILRIDVRGATAEQPYRIPSDNPFRDIAHARGEVWAFGFRNPWRISIDPPTGQLWLGDVGWEKWELVHRVVRGGNYGWSVREGHELIQPDQPLGPGPILPTRVAISHADAASITGGFVYRGSKLPAIQNQYLFGDWVTGRIWSLPLDETSEHREVASGQLRIIAFAPDRDGEPLVVNHFNSTTLFRLVKNPEYEMELTHMKDFPRRLSQTGLFRDTHALEANPGVREFTINQPQWQDGAIGKHLLALPDLQKVTVFNEPQPVGAIAMFNSRLHYPSGTVLAKTLFFPGKSQVFEPNSDRKIETQLLHFDGRLWRGYSYVWNEDQTDAELAPAAGMDLSLPGTNRQRWRVHSRTECLQCHNPWPETTLAFAPEQLHQPAKGSASQWLTLVREGYVETLNPQRTLIEPDKCVRRSLSASADAPLDLKARSYLHANCAHCHQNGAGAAVDLSLKITDSDQALKAINIAPSKGDLGLKDGKLIASGDSLSSVLLFRMASSSAGRMPHIGSREVDFSAIKLISDWINRMSQQQASQKTSSGDDMLRAANAILESFAVAGSNTGANSTMRQDRLRMAMKLAVDLAGSNAITKDSLPSGAELAEQTLPGEVLSKLAHVPDPMISSLFEAFVPARDRQRRLGPGATYVEIADLSGNPATGEAWFFDLNKSQCAKCHRVGQRGGQVGPDLLHIGTKLSPSQLFESIVDPSRIIEPRYQSHTVLLTDGKVITGLLDEESAQQLRLINAQGEKITIDIADIESRKLDTKSIMPTGLGGELTAQQTADLLAYLSSLR